MVWFGSPILTPKLPEKKNYAGPLFAFFLSDMFRRSASLAIPHHKSFAAIPSVSLVLLGHTNRSVLVSHEPQREIALV